jgi:hypothetical protein
MMPPERRRPHPACLDPLCVHAHAYGLIEAGVERVDGQCIRPNNTGAFPHGCERHIPVPHKPKGRRR